MSIKRFLLFWLGDYVAATIIVFTIAMAGRVMLNMPSLTYLSLMYIPIGTVFFSWLAYRGVAQENAHRWVIAAVWVGLAVIVDLIVAVVVAQVNVAAFLSSPMILATYGTKFLAVFVGAYLGLSPSAQPIPAVDTPSPRSA